MKEALLKKRHGIPAALLMLLVLAGVATAVVVQTFAYPITTEEPLSFRVTDNLVIAYQGESDDIKVKATNASTKEGYGIFVDASVTDGQVDLVTYSSNPANKLFSTEKELNEDVNIDGDVLDARYNIGADKDYEIVVTVDSADDVDPGDLNVELKFQREAKYLVT